MSKPKYQQQGQLIRTNLRRDEINELSEIAKRDGRTRSNFVTKVLQDVIRGLKKEGAENRPDC